MKKKSKLRNLTWAKTDNYSRTHSPQGLHWPGIQSGNIISFTFPPAYYSNCLQHTHRRQKSGDPRLWLEIGNKFANIWKSHNALQQAFSWLPQKIKTTEIKLQSYFIHMLQQCCLLENEVENHFQVTSCIMKTLNCN